MAGSAKTGIAWPAGTVPRADLIRYLEKVAQVFVSLLRRAANANSSCVVSQVSLAVAAKK